MAKPTNETKTAADYRSVLRTKHDETKRIVDDCEARLPELKRNFDVSKHAVETFVKDVRIQLYQPARGAKPMADRGDVGKDPIKTRSGFFPTAAVVRNET